MRFRKWLRGCYEFFFLYHSRESHLSAGNSFVLTSSLCWHQSNLCTADLTSLAPGFSLLGSEGKWPVSVHLTPFPGSGKSPFLGFISRQLCIGWLASVNKPEMVPSPGLHSWSCSPALENHPHPSTPELRVWSGTHQHTEPVSLCAECLVSFN